MSRINDLIAELCPDGVTYIAEVTRIVARQSERRTPIDTILANAGEKQA